MFGKKKVATPEVAVSEGKYAPEIQQIHDEFYGASDELLKEAEKALSELKNVDKDKVERLDKLGFGAVKQVRQAQHAEKVEKDNTERMHLVNYYRMTYPMYKFITEDRVKKICRKYKLVFGGVDRYTGFVPEKNLREIEDFKGLRDSDYMYTYRSMYGDKHTVSFTDYMAKRAEEGKTMVQTDGVFSEYFALRHRMAEGNNIKNASKDTELQICAPASDMNTSGMRITDGYKLEEIPDPVVLHPCRGGYLILTAWGPEASDPEVINEINN